MLSLFFKSLFLKWGNKNSTEIYNFRTQKDHLGMVIPFSGLLVYFLSCSKNVRSILSLAWPMGNLTHRSTKTLLANFIVFGVDHQGLKEQCIKDNNLKN